MTAREEFYFMLNNCDYPRATYNVLMALATSSTEENPENPRASLLEAVKGGEQE